MLKAPFFVCDSHHDFLQLRLLQHDLAIAIPTNEFEGLQFSGEEIAGHGCQALHFMISLR